MPIDEVEQLVEDLYVGICLTAERSQALRRYIHDRMNDRRAEAERERRSHEAGLRTLDDERRKLLQLHYRDQIAPDLFADEQSRIRQKMDTARRRLDSIAETFADLDKTLETALTLAAGCHLAYRHAGPKARRQINQAFFEKVFVHDDDGVRSELAEPFAVLLGGQLAAEVEASPLQLAGRPSERRRQGHHCPSRWRGFEREAFGGPCESLFEPL